MKSFYHEGQVEADGETLTLVCDFGAIMAAEGVSGQDWDELLGQMTSRTVATQITWALLRRKHEGVTLDQAANLMFGNDQTAVCQCVFDVLSRACNLSSTEPEEVAKKKSRGRQRTSESVG